MSSIASKEPVDSVRILMAKSCPSITGKSTLTYHVGVFGNEPRIRIHGNSGPGFFNAEWISLFKVIDALPKLGSFPSRVLLKAFQGRSQNSYAFLMAVLHQEGVVKRSSVHQRCWERADVDALLSRIDLAAESKDASKAVIPTAKASGSTKAVVKSATKPSPSKPTQQLASKSVSKPKK
jgi:hypothetical protein